MGEFGDSVHQYEGDDITNVWMTQTVYLPHNFLQEIQLQISSNEYVKDKDKFLIPQQLHILPSLPWSFTNNDSLQEVDIPTSQLFDLTLHQICMYLIKFMYFAKIAILQYLQSCLPVVIFYLNGDVLLQGIEIDHLQTFVCAIEKVSIDWFE